MLRLGVFVCVLWVTIHPWEPLCIMTDCACVCLCRIYRVPVPVQYRSSSNWQGRVCEQLSDVGYGMYNLYAYNLVGEDGEKWADGRTGPLPESLKIVT